jgi:hypothetical protein
MKSSCGITDLRPRSWSFLVSAYLRDYDLLGTEWSIFAKRSLQLVQGTTKTLVDSEVLFDACVETWLELRREINVSAEKSANEEKFEVDCGTAFLNA